MFCSDRLWGNFHPETSEVPPIFPALYNLTGDKLKEDIKCLASAVTTGKLTKSVAAYSAPSTTMYLNADVIVFLLLQYNILIKFRF